MIILKSGQLTAHVSRKGAALMGLWHASFPFCLTVSPANPEEFSLEPYYCGALVGPVANRISNACITIKRQKWRLAPNEGTTTLHNGTDGLHSKVWQVTAQTETSVTLEVELPHGDAGLPGHRRITARYSLEPENCVVLDITAQTDRTTVINIAHHPYWNLDGADTVANHLLLIAAEKFTPTDPENLPTGEVMPLNGSNYDFRKPKLIPTEQALDANLCLADVRRAATEFAARLSVSCGPTLEIFTTEPGLQVYNGSGLSDDGTKLHDGRKFGPFAGVALEPQGWPNAPNTPGFPPISLTPEQVYQQQTRYHISQ